MFFAIQNLYSIPDNDFSQTKEKEKNFSFPWKLCEQWIIFPFYSIDHVLWIVIGIGIIKYQFGFADLLLKIKNLNRHSHKFRRRKKTINNMKLNRYKNVCLWIYFALFDCFTSKFVYSVTLSGFFINRQSQWFGLFHELRRFHAARGSGPLGVIHYFIGTNEKTFPIENVCHVSRDTVRTLRWLWTNTLFSPFSFVLILQTI